MPATSPAAIPAPSAAPSAAALVSRIDRVIANLSDGLSCAASSGRKRPRPAPPPSPPPPPPASPSSIPAGGTYGAPPGLEAQYSELRRLLSRGLVGSGGDAGGSGGAKRSVAALLMGPRGCGKGLVLEAVLADLKGDGGAGERQRFFRIVRLNGLLLRGDDAGAAVWEIVRQLSEVAVAEARHRRRGEAGAAAGGESGRRGGGGGGGGGEDSADGDGGGGGGTSIASDLLRIRRTSFNSNLSLLDETLRAARVDSMPVLVVLDELDAFLPAAGPGAGGGRPPGVPGPAAGGGGQAPRHHEQSGPSSSDRQLLLYHLLDRVADHRSLLSLVGITSQLATVSTFEKRVRSRAEGTSRIVYFGRPATFGGLVAMLSSKFDVEGGAGERDGEHDEVAAAAAACRRFGDQLVGILLPSRSHRGAAEAGEGSGEARARAMFRRNYQLGKDCRWFCRVLTVALSMMAADVLAGREGASLEPQLRTSYLVEALMTMGGLVRTEEDSAMAVSIGTGGQLGRSLSSRGSTDAQNAGMLYGPFDKDGRPIVMPGWDDPRIQEIVDLPESQVAIILSARRILRRDAADDSSVPKPLTFGRIQKEFETFLRGSVGSGLRTDLYEGNALHLAFLHLMETGLVCPAVDHTGGGPLQYYMHHTRTHAAMEPMALAKMPLHILVDIQSELGTLLKEKQLDCSTALREWGLRIN